MILVTPHRYDANSGCIVGIRFSFKNVPKLSLYYYTIIHDSFMGVMGIYSMWSVAIADWFLFVW